MTKQLKGINIKINCSTNRLFCQGIVQDEYIGDKSLNCMGV